MSPHVIKDTGLMSRRCLRCCVQEKHWFPRFKETILMSNTVYYELFAHNHSMPAAAVTAGRMVQT